MHLPGRLYLLCYDPHKQRFAMPHYLRLALSSAALEELRLRGALTDDNGIVRAAAHPRLTDPVLDPILRDVGAGRPRKWQAWVRSTGKRAIVRHVRDQLEDSLHIRVEPRRVLGIFPGTRVTLRDLKTVTKLRDKVLGALTTARPVESLDPHDVALLALASVVGIRALLPRELHRQHKARIKEIVEHVGPAPAALKRALSEEQASSAGG